MFKLKKKLSFLSCFYFSIGWRFKTAKKIVTILIDFDVQYDDARLNIFEEEKFTANTGYQ